jgi:pimeloyl-ACP methyl ester carboxylesterase
MISPGVTVRRFSRLLVPLSLLFGSVSAVSQPHDTLAAALPLGFAYYTASQDGNTLHYVRGGAGPALILIHGFPQDWFEYHAIMPNLARHFTVIAVDLRGVGDSTATTGGYDASTMAQDIYQLTLTLRLHHVYLVGHDLGGMVAYAFLRRYPQATRGAMILDAPLPGIRGWEQILGDPSVWHVHFMQVPNLPEQLVTGRTADYLAYFFHFAHFTEREKSHFIHAYASPSQLHAAFEMYRAFPVTAQFNAAQREPNHVPIFFAAGEHSPFAKMVPTFAEGLRANGCTQVETGLIPGAVHYVVEDQPDRVAALIARYAALPAQ